MSATATLPSVGNRLKEAIQAAHPQASVTVLEADGMFTARDLDILPSLIENYRDIYGTGAAASVVASIAYSMSQGAYVVTLASDPSEEGATNG